MESRWGRFEDVLPQNPPPPRLGRSTSPQLGPHRDAIITPRCGLVRSSWGLSGSAKISG